MDSGHQGKPKVNWERSHSMETHKQGNINKYTHLFPKNWLVPKDIKYLAARNQGNRYRESSKLAVSIPPYVMWRIQPTRHT
jgi:hypothetical protein